jgi:hypothetical protein
MSKPLAPETMGIALGPKSPLLTASGAKRRLQPSEADVQVALLELLVGPAKAGERRIPGAGMTHRFPELALIYAINPNKGGQRQVAARGLAKAMGQLRDMPDLHLPVQRGQYIGLYLELKRPGRCATKEQRTLHAELRREGQLVHECTDVSGAVAEIVAYLRLPYLRDLLIHAMRATAGSGA